MSLDPNPGAATPADSPPSGAVWPLPDVVLVAMPDHLLGSKYEPDFHIDTRRLKVQNPHHNKQLHSVWGMNQLLMNWLLGDPVVQDLMVRYPAMIEQKYLGSATDLPITVVTTCIGAFHRSPGISALLGRKLAKMGFSCQVRVYHGKRHIDQTWPKNLPVCHDTDTLLKESELHLVLGLNPMQHNEVGMLLPKTQQDLLFLQNEAGGA